MRIEKELNCSGLAFPSANHSSMDDGDYGDEEMSSPEDLDPVPEQQQQPHQPTTEGSA
jgi:hypothetical protein